MTKTLEKWASRKIIDNRLSIKKNTAKSFSGKLSFILEKSQNEFNIISK